MANAALFSTKNRSTKADTVNQAGGRAYSMSDKHALAQMAATGMLGSTYYASADSQLDTVLELAQKVPVDFLAKVAIYSRQAGYMKDMPALLVAVLASRDVELCKRVFPSVIDNGRMLRNFVQIMRSGVTGRRSLGSAPKKLVKAWLDGRRDDQIFRDSVGTNPSLADVIKMVHPSPSDKSRDQLYAYLIGGKYDGRSLPKLVKAYEKFKKGTPGNREVPNVPFQMLDSLELTNDEWKSVAENARWQMTRMNLNTFARHGIFEDRKLTKMITERLRDADNVHGAMAFPYQLLQAHKNVGDGVPKSVKAALEDAMEISVDNVPRFEGKVFVAVDVSGSMSWAVSDGFSRNAMSCREIAALFASCIVRNNPDTDVYRFTTTAQYVDLNPRDSIMSNAETIFRGPSGGTDCSCVIRELNRKNEKGDAIILLSDNESWADRGYYSRGSTGTTEEFRKFQKRNPGAKLINVDLAANKSTQAKETKDGSILNVGGFSDKVFNVVGAFLESNAKPEYWAKLIEDQISIP